MADSRHSLGLLNLPLEVRHRIFGYLAVRDTSPKKLLRFWFEKKEIQELSAQYIAANPEGCRSPKIVYPDSRYDPLDTEDEPEDDEEGESDGESESDENDEDDGDEDDGDEDNGDDGGEGDDSENDDGESDGNEEGENDADEDEPTQDDEEAEDQVMPDGTVCTATSNPATQALPPVPVFRPQSKWRHIPNFMRISRCPPPLELLLTCKQLREEATNWFYGASIIRIEATGSFAHTSFFEEAFSQIIDTAFSPMENARRVEVVFAWDTTWVRADKGGCVAPIFSTLLRQRSELVVGILAQAPNLREVIVHWHDSAQDDESASLKNEVLASFLNLPADVKVKEYYISADTKPTKRSIAGKRRAEFQDIVDRGTGVF